MTTFFFIRKWKLFKTNISLEKDSIHELSYFRTFFSKSILNLLKQPVSTFLKAPFSVEMTFYSKFKFIYCEKVYIERNISIDSIQYFSRFLILSKNFRFFFYSCLNSTEKIFRKLEHFPWKGNLSCNQIKTELIQRIKWNLHEFSSVWTCLKMMSLHFSMYFAQSFPQEWTVQET